ncbi:MAG: hypothetical protein Pg6A_19950 [Termitinemataceae bacterium]|nr:MAG: hypothetical protein Pg6A_19950 [Termitinemataceae bacterium]
MEHVKGIIEALGQGNTMLILAMVFVLFVFVGRPARNKHGKWYWHDYSVERRKLANKLCPPVTPQGIRAKDFDELRNKLDGLIEDVHECQAWAQRIMLFSENYTIGERLAAGSRLEQLSDGWKKDDCCYNGEAKNEYMRLQELLRQGIDRNEHCKNMARPLALNHGNGNIEHVRRDRDHVVAGV